MNDAAALAEAAAEEFVRAALAAAAGRGRFTVALAGGRTPRGLYARLADPRHPWRERVPWDKVHVFFADERQVPPDHPDSNCRMASEILLLRVPIPEEQVHRIRGENPDPERAAEEYGEILIEAFALGPGERPRFDLVLLGMGTDGHTASLFPSSPALRETQRLAAPVRVPPPDHDRVTLTLPVLNAAAAVIVLADGAGKAEALARVAATWRDVAPAWTPGVGAGGPGAGAAGQGDAPPAALVRPQRGTLLWIVDRAAAGRLSS